MPHRSQRAIQSDDELLYVVLVSKFIEYFGIDVEDELEELT